MTLTDWFWAIPVFGLLIFIHELGHFSVAKYFDIRVHDFALGFGPVVAGFRRGETRYSLRLVPLGGFVRMAGMEEGDADDPRGFNQKPLYARGLVIAAGPIMNFVLAAVLYSGYLYVADQPIPVLADVPETCVEMVAGQPASKPCPAFAAGLRKGDRILKIDGRPVAEWNDVLWRVTESEGMPITFQVQRGEEIKEFSLKPIHSDGRWMVGIVPGTQPETLGRALIGGPVTTVKMSVAWLTGLTEMILGKVQPQLSGPIGITREIAEQASRGWENLLLLTAFLSINLGMFNLLPIPALDGSRLVFMVVELVRGRRVDPQRENMVHFVGFLLLIGLMVVITYSEVVRR